MSLFSLIAGRAKAGFQQPTPKARADSKCPACGARGAVAMTFARLGATAYRCTRENNHPQWRVWGETRTPERKGQVGA